MIVPFISGNRTQKQSPQPLGAVSQLAQCQTCQARANQGHVGHLGVDLPFEAVPTSSQHVSINHALGNLFCVGVICMRTIIPSF
jgi:hypothetical protein